VRIAVYLEQYSWGGVGTHLLNLLTSLQNAGDEVVLFTNVENAGYYLIKDQMQSLSGVKVELFPSRSFAKALKPNSSFIARWRVRALNFLFLPLAVYRMELQARHLFLKMGPFDALISENGGYPAAWGCIASVFAAKSLNIPKRVLIVHHAATLPSPVRKTWEKWIDRRICSAATSIVAVSKATKETLYKNRFIPRSLPVEVVYNGIQIDPLVADPPSVLRKNYATDGALLIGVMGRIEPYKGHDDLIEALKAMPEEYLSRVRVLFIGKGEPLEIERLKCLAGEAVWKRIVLTGYVEGEPRAIIAGLDLVCVLTKDFEGFGLTLAEAMSVKVPVLATHVGAIPEFVEHGVTGYLVAPESPQAVRSALLEFVNNRVVWQQRAERAEAKIREFSCEKMGSELRKLL
jgi:glycosyltransferase involved in cell wall biosynthesis